MRIPARKGRTGIAQIRRILRDSLRSTRLHCATWRACFSGSSICCIRRSKLGLGHAASELVSADRNTGSTRLSGCDRASGDISGTWCGICGSSASTGIAQVRAPLPNGISGRRGSEKRNRTASIGIRVTHCVASGDHERPIRSQKCLRILRIYIAPVWRSVFSMLRNLVLMIRRSFFYGSST